MTTTSLDFSAELISEALPFVLSHSLLTTTMVFAALIAIPLSLRFELHGWEYELSTQAIRKRTMNIARYFIFANVIATLFAVIELVPSSQILFAIVIMMIAMMIALNNILPFIPGSGIFTFFWVLSINLWNYQKLQSFGQSHHLMFGTLFNLLLTFSTLFFVMMFVALFYRLNRHPLFVNYGVQILSAAIAYQVIYWFTRFL